LTFLIRNENSRWPVLWAFLVRLPAGALALLLPLLALSYEMSAVVSGAALALCRMGQAIAGPFWGNLDDRHSMRRVVGVATAPLAPVLLMLAL
jgi:MFS family permease